MLSAAICSQQLPPVPVLLSAALNTAGDTITLTYSRTLSGLPGDGLWFTMYIGNIVGYPMEYLVVNSATVVGNTVICDVTAPAGVVNQSAEVYLHYENYPDGYAESGGTWTTGGTLGNSGGLAATVGYDPINSLELENTPVDNNSTASDPTPGTSPTWNMGYLYPVDYEFSMFKTLQGDTRSKYPLTFILDGIVAMGANPFNTAGFTVKVNGNPVAIDADGMWGVNPTQSTLELLVSTPILSTDTVTLEYDATANTLWCKDYVELASFGPVSVMNMLYLP